MKKLTFLLCALVCASALSAQTYYIAGNDALMGVTSCESWKPACLALTDGSYTFQKLPAGSNYQFKITNGTWDQKWGFDALNTDCSNVTCSDVDGDNHNIGFALTDALNDVTITFDGSKICITAQAVSIDPSEIIYSIKHGWKDGQDASWSYKDLTPNGDGTYSIRDIYGGTGCNWKSTISSEKWISDPTLVGSPAVGDSAVFTLDPTAGDKAITITKIGAAGGDEGGESGEGGEGDEGGEGGEGGEGTDPEPGKIVIKVQIPDDLTAWDYTVEPYVYSWATGAEGKFAAQPMSLVDGWYTHTFDVAVANFIIVNGNDWPEDKRRQSVNMENVTADACYIMGNGEEIVGEGPTWNKTLTATECEATALQAVTVADIYARDGRIYGAEGMRIYTVSGMDVTDQNGQLNGIYIVKAQTGVYKIAVK